MKMPFADFHCDTLTVLLENEGNLFENSLNFDAKYAKNFTKIFETFAIFIPENLGKTEAREYYKRNIDYFYNLLSKNSDTVKLVKSAEDLEENGKIKIMLSIENFSFIDEKEIENVFSDGVRIASLSWNSDNSIVGGAYGTGRLSERAKELIKYMEKTGLTLDISHLNFDSANAALDISKRPVAATHSSSFALRESPRNLTDELYLKVAKSGGVAGVNFHRDFIGEDANAAAVARHIDRFYKLSPTAVVFGSDFDGADMPFGIEGLKDMDIIFAEMEKYKISAENLYKNAIEFLKRIL